VDKVATCLVQSSRCHNVYYTAYSYMMQTMRTVLTAAASSSPMPEGRGIRCRAVRVTGPAEREGQQRMREVQWGQQEAAGRAPGRASLPCVGLTGGAGGVTGRAERERHRRSGRDGRAGEGGGHPAGRRRLPFVFLSGGKGRARRSGHTGVKEAGQREGS
jgi:hypothetical protein